MDKTKMRDRRSTTIKKHIDVLRLKEYMGFLNQPETVTTRIEEWYGEYYQIRRKKE